MIKNMATEFLNGQMEDNLSENGLMVIKKKIESLGK